MKKINKKKKFLVIVATHGDEAFSLPIVKKIEKKFPNEFDYIIGNPKALKENKRFIDVDLNRVAPGKEKSSFYEEKRAKEIMQKSRDYSFTIDIHGTVSSSDIFTIVTNPTPQNMFLAYSLPIKKIVIWGSKNNGRQTGPLSRFVDCGVGLECGPKDSLGIKKKLENILDDFLSRKNKISTNDKELYQVFGSVKNSELKNIKIKLKDFKEVSLNGQKFFPLLVNQYRNDGIVCYKLRKVDFYQKFSFPY
jgi:succinylglutamate desuccinylase